MASRRRISEQLAVNGSAHDQATLTSSLKQRRFNLPRGWLPRPERGYNIGVKRRSQSRFFLRLRVPLSRISLTQALSALQLRKDFKTPLYFSKGLSAPRTGRIRVLPFSITNSTRSPAERPMRFRIS